jgi:hypothetical protein
MSSDTGLDYADGLPHLVFSASAMPILLSASDCRKHGLRIGDSSARPAEETYPGAVPVTRTSLRTSSEGKAVRSLRSGIGSPTQRNRGRRRRLDQAVRPFPSPSGPVATGLTTWPTVTRAWTPRSQQTMMSATFGLERSSVLTWLTSSGRSLARTHSTGCITPPFSGSALSFGP